jgi:hypothetical protein
VDAKASTFTSSKLSTLRPANTTDQPFCTKASAVAFPMPEPAPVTMATFEDGAMALLDVLLMTKPPVFSVWFF